jgi:glutamate 5-kinase
MKIRQRLGSANTVVVKIGSKVLIHSDGSIAHDIVERLAKSVSALLAEGRRVLLVSSGAVGLGAWSLGVSPSLVGICAAAGQSVLTSCYHQTFSRLKISTAQVLLTDDDFRSKRRREELSHTLQNLMELSVVPILNENDVVTFTRDSPASSRIFSDNDMLASLIARDMNADLLVILTDVDGIYDSHPETSGASLVPEVRSLMAFEDEGEIHELGRGGIDAKLRAALHATQLSKLVAVIANGRTPNVLEKIVGGYPIGTLITAGEVQ